MKVQLKAAIRKVESIENTDFDISVILYWETGNQREYRLSDLLKSSQILKH